MSELMGLEKVRDKNTGRFAIKHGERHSCLYRVWEGIRRRCNDPKLVGYENYGGRGITVCSEWENNASAFIQWAKEHGYKKGLSIDRIDVNGNYEPNNCCWILLPEQGKNTRRIRFLTIDGETKYLTEWANLVNLKPSTISRRIDEYSWDAKSAVFSPTTKRKGNRIQCE